MATGVQSNTVSERYTLFRLVDGTTVDVAAPSAATSGVALPSNLQSKKTERVILLVSDRSGTGTLGFTYAKLWGYIAVLGKWFPCGTGADADRGKINEGLATGEVAADDLRLAEMVSDVMIFDRLAVEINTITGTNPVIDVDLAIPTHLARSV